MKNYITFIALLILLAFFYKCSDDQDNDVLDLKLDLKSDF